MIFMFPELRQQQQTCFYSSFHQEREVHHSQIVFAATLSQRLVFLLAVIGVQIRLLAAAKLVYHSLFLVKSHHLVHFR